MKWVMRLTVLLVALGIAAGQTKQTQAATQTTTTTSWVKIIQDASPAIVVIETENSLGGGFFVDSNGTVVTNHHVIAGAKEITVKVSNGEIYRRA